MIAIEIFDTARSVLVNSRSLIKPCALPFDAQAPTGFPLKPISQVFRVSTHQCQLGATGNQQRPHQQRAHGPLTFFVLLLLENVRELSFRL